MKDEKPPVIDAEFEVIREPDRPPLEERPHWSDYLKGVIIFLIIAVSCQMAWGPGTRFFDRLFFGG